MRRLSLSEFKANLSAVVRRVEQTGLAVEITRHGVPVAKIVPPRKRLAVGWLGCMLGRAREKGDIVSPVVPPSAWNALRR